MLVPGEQSRSIWSRPARLGVGHYELRGTSYSREDSTWGCRPYIALRTVESIWARMGIGDKRVRVGAASGVTVMLGMAAVLGVHCNENG